MELHAISRSDLRAGKCWIFLFYGSIISCASQPRQVPDIPSGAHQMHFYRCVLDEHPSLADIAPGRTGKYKWFSGQWYKSTPPTLEHYASISGGLTVSLGGDLVSAPIDFSPGLIPTLAGSKGFYVEFEVSLSDVDPDHFPALWLMPVEHNRLKQDHYDSDPTDFERWVEFDIDEGGAQRGYAGAVHMYSGIYPKYERSSKYNLPAQELDRIKKHKFGIGVDTLREQVTWWLDDRLKTTLRIHGLGEIASKQHYYLIISAQSHGLQKPYMIQVYAVRAYVAE